MKTKDRILVESIKIITEQGIQGFSLRKLASRLGIKAPSLYEHYKNKSAILDALREYGAQKLSDRLLAIQETDVWALIQQQGMAYLDFAKEEDQLFQLFFFQMESTRPNLQTLPTPNSPYLLLLRAFAQAVPGCPQETLEELVLGYWSLLHGLVVLRCTHLKGFEMDWDSSGLRILQTYLSGVSHENDTK